MPMHHLGIHVRDINEARDFYLATLKPLGYKVIMTFAEGEVLGLGVDTPEFWLSGPNAPGGGSNTTGPLHLAFTAETREQVDKFHEAALAAGGKDNGPPGLRPQYSSTYYGAFILDAEGRNIEAVSFKES